VERPATAFNPASYSDVPLYNIQAVSAATGVPAITLRSWERRYGVPLPKRDEKGYRLYSERDVAVTRWLKERVHRGVGISRAINMLRTLEAGRLSVEEKTGFNLDTLRDRLLDAAVRLDENAVSRIVAEALIVASVEDVVLNIFQPVLRSMGEAWAAGDLSVTTEHFASNILRNHVAQLVRISPPPVREARVVVACAPGELHDIGALVLALFLRRRGFDVVYVGANIEPDDFIADVIEMNPDAVLLSAARAETALAMKGMARALSSRYGGLVAYGGRAFELAPELRDAIPGTFLGRDAAEATMALEHAFTMRAADFA
jgi:MerR family transcriptional regulator, light-induced transcriptional regulator